MSIMQNVGIVRRLTKELKKLCTLMRILHVPLLVHRTMLSPFYRYYFKLVPMRLNKWLGINVCPNVV
jgi:hypothetical protein